MDARTWDERYTASRQWSLTPNQFVAEAVEPLPPGRALDLACGEGRNAIWLAGRGWHVTALAFSLGALVAGLSGSLLAHQYTYINPDVFNFQTSLLVLTIVVLGGMSSVPGTVLGAIILVGLPEVFRPLAEVRILAYGLALLLLVRFRPQGLMGVR